MIDHRSYAHNLSSLEIRAPEKKNSGLNVIWPYDLCDTSAVLYQRSYPESHQGAGLIVSTHRRWIM